MAFCKYCGKELKDGEVCSCRTTTAGSSEAGAAQPAAAAATQTTAAQPAAATAQTTMGTAQAAGAATTAGATAQATAGAATTAGATAQTTAGAAAAGAAAAPKVDTEKIASTAKKVGGMYLKIWAKPATVGKEMMASADMIQGLCMIVVQALLSSIFSLCIAGKINAAISSYTSLLGSDYAKQFKVSGAKVFFLTLLLSLLFSVIWGLAFALVGLISKAKMGLGQIVALMAARSVIVAPLTVLACIVFWISPAVGLVIFFGSILMVICTTTEMLKAVQGVTADKCVYLTFIGVLLFIIVFVLIGSKAIGAYIPEGIISSLDSVSSLF